MPTSTTPDGIVAPANSDPIGPLHTWFQQLATSVQTALTAMRTEFAQTPLPAPISIRGADTQVVAAAAWADLPNAPAITLELPKACWVEITVGAWVAATGGDTRASASVAGATVLGETQLEVGGSTSSWGQVMYATGGSTRQQVSTRVVRLNPGTNTIRIRAYQSAGGSGKVVNYSTMQVTPIRWA